MTAGANGLAASTVLRPGIRTFKPRRSRMTKREAAALTAYADLRLPFSTDELDLSAIWGVGTPVVMEIGFGSGTTTAAMGASSPSIGILAVDIHTPGVGDLLDLIGEQDLTNVRVMEADAIAVLEFMIAPGSLAGVRSFFPDPWPKARHHKRRLVQPDIATLVASRLSPGGYWQLATDWDEYAQAMQVVFAADPQWSGGLVPRSDDRPLTHYETRALRAGRTVADLRYEFWPSKTST